MMVRLDRHKFTAIESDFVDHNYSIWVLRYSCKEKCVMFNMSSPIFPLFLSILLP